MDNSLDLMAHLDPMALLDHKKTTESNPARIGIASNLRNKNRSLKKNMSVSTAIKIIQMTKTIVQTTIALMTRKTSITVTMKTIMLISLVEEVITKKDTNLGVISNNPTMRSVTI